jgi:signal transduction histidine kinase
MLALFVVLLMVSFSYAADTTAKAKAMVEKAAAYIKANGKDKAMAEFNNPKGSFIDGHLYIFAVDFSGITLANGGTPALVGKDMKGLKDSEGKLFIAEMIELAKTKGSGWVNYNWQNKETKKIEPKTSYVQKVDNYFIGCGTNRPK